MDLLFVHVKLCQHASNDSLRVNTCNVVTNNIYMYVHWLDISHKQNGLFLTLNKSTITSLWLSAISLATLVWHSAILFRTTADLAQPRKHWTVTRPFLSPDIWYNTLWTMVSISILQSCCIEHNGCYETLCWLCSKSTCPSLNSWHILRIHNNGVSQYHNLPKICQWG